MKRRSYGRILFSGDAKLYINWEGHYCLSNSCFLMKMNFFWIFLIKTALYIRAISRFFSFPHNYIDTYDFTNYCIQHEFWLEFNNTIHYISIMGWTNNAQYTTKNRQGFNQKHIPHFFIEVYICSIVPKELKRRPFILKTMRKFKI